MRRRILLVGWFLCTCTLQATPTPAQSDGVPTGTVGVSCDGDKSCISFEDKSESPIHSLTVWHGGLLTSGFEHLQVRFVGERGPRPARGDVENACMKEKSGQTQSTLQLPPHAHIISLCGTVHEDGSIRSLNISSSAALSYGFHWKPRDGVEVISVGNHTIGAPFCFADGPIVGFHGTTSVARVAFSGEVCPLRMVKSLGVVYKHSQNVNHVFPAHWHSMSKTDKNGVCVSRICSSSIGGISRVQYHNDKGNFEMKTDSQDRMYGTIADNTKIFADVVSVSDEITKRKSFIRQIILYSNDFIGFLGFRLGISTNGVTRYSPIRGNLTADRGATKSTLVLSPGESIVEVCGRVNSRISFLAFKTSAARNVSVGDAGEGRPFCFRDGNQSILGFHGGHSVDQLDALGVVFDSRNASGALGRDRNKSDSHNHTCSSNSIPSPDPMSLLQHPTVKI